MDRISAVAKHITANHNVSIRVIDQRDNSVVSSHTGHNAATNSLLSGIAHYLTGDGVLNQGYHMLSAYVPKYISLGTMGLSSQESDEYGLPKDLGSIKGTEEERFKDYILSTPGFGADGYDDNQNNSRPYSGLGPSYINRPDKHRTIDCELVSTSFPRAKISFRDIVPETESELPQTIDVIFSAMISTGALQQFREPDRDYVFITEAGIWSRPDWTDGGDNGLLAGYRIAPPNQENWGMAPESITDDLAIKYLNRQGNDDPTKQEIKDIKYQMAPENRQILKKNIIKVARNQVVQVIWKIQLGGMDQLGGITSLYPNYKKDIKWTNW